MNFYKILHKDETHHGLAYKTGLNTDPIPFQKEGSCVAGGIYFARKDILAFLHIGPWIRKVTVPKNAQVVKDPSKPEKWRASAVELGEREEITAKVIEGLIQEGAKVRAGDNESLRWAVTVGHLEIVKILLKHGANASMGGGFLLRLAAEQGHLEIVELLLEYGVNACNYCDNDWLLRRLTGRGYTEIVRVLEEYIRRGKP